jgi:hypothetical protein
MEPTASTTGQIGNGDKRTPTGMTNILLES